MSVCFGIDLSNKYIVFCGASNLAFSTHTHTAVSESISMDINGNTTASIVWKDTVRFAPHTIEEWMRLFSNKFNGIHYTAQKHRALSKRMQPNAANACVSYATNDDYTQRMN